MVRAEPRAKTAIHELTVLAFVVIQSKAHVLSGSIAEGLLWSLVVSSKN